MEYIYFIKNPKNQIYVGKTKDYIKRFDSYSKLQCVEQKLLYNSIKEYGWDNHKTKIIEFTNFINPQIIFDIENYYIIQAKIFGYDLLNIKYSSKNIFKLYEFVNEKYQKNIFDEWFVENDNKVISLYIMKFYDEPINREFFNEITTSTPSIQ